MPALMPPDNESLLALADGTLTVLEVANRLGVPASRVYARAAVLRASGHQVRFLRSRRGADVGTFIAAVTGATASEAAARLGVRRGHVYARAARLRVLGIAVPRFLKPPSHRARQSPPQVGEACPVCGAVATKAQLSRENEPRSFLGGGSA